MPDYSLPNRPLIRGCRIVYNPRGCRTVDHPAEAIPLAPCTLANGHIGPHRSEAGHAWVATNAVPLERSAT